MDSDRLRLRATFDAAARRALAPFPAVEVVNASFEEWQPERESPFNLIFAAAAGPAAGRPDGRVRRGWGAVLHVARRRDGPEPV